MMKGRCEEECVKNRYGKGRGGGYGGEQYEFETLVLCEIFNNFV